MPDYPLFSQTEAAAAADMDPAQLSQWLQRGEPILSEERDVQRGERTGRFRRFSGPTILQLALARELVRRGASVSGGLLVGMAFVGTARGFGSPARPCGGLWPDAETLAICVSPERDEYTFAPEERVVDAMVTDFHGASLGSIGFTSAIIVSVTALNVRAASVLGVASAALLEPAPRPEQDPSSSEPAGAPEFLWRCCVRDPRSRVGTSELYTKYAAWCSRHGRKKALRPQAFGRAVIAAGIPRVKSNGRMVFKGLATIVEQGASDPSR